MKFETIWSGSPRDAIRRIATDRDAPAAASRRPSEIRPYLISSRYHDALVALVVTA